MLCIHDSVLYVEMHEGNSGNKSYIVEYIV